MTEQTQTVLYQQDERGVVTITLNRPEAMNALNEQVEMIVALVAPKGLDKKAKTKLLAAADELANSSETQEFITGNLLMRPVRWGEAHADKTAKELYDIFGKQAAMMK